MKHPFDPFCAGEAFADLDAAWRHDRDSCLEHCRELTRDVRSVNEKVMAHLQAHLPDPEADGGQALLLWVDNLAWAGKQYHSVLNRWISDYIDQAPRLNPGSRSRAHFWMRQVMEMLAPGNFFWSNPEAVRRFLKSRGESLNQGLHNRLEDIQNEQGLVGLVAPGSFEVGRNIAATPGYVVYRNHLFELIQYAPQTDTVWSTPIVLIQPWINKYYIFDLSSRNSFVAFLVRQGFTVFITSWKNPDPSMRSVSFEDYLLHGALQAVSVARKICQSDSVHATGYCIGGTLLAVLLAWLAGQSAPGPVVDGTLFSSLVDFSDPGDLGAIIHPGAMAVIERLTACRGILEKHHIAMTFRMLNPGDLIWRYVVNNYFYGEPPPRSDMLYWNSDGTNLPQTMCMEYLEWFYLENRLTRSNVLTLGGHSIDLKNVQLPIYIVGSAKDHICPWRSTFQTCGLVNSKVRYILTDEGHITGIVNPPSPWSKKQHWAGAATRRRDADKWLRRQTPNKGSWWPDWVRWLKPRNGERVAPPPMGSDRYRPIEPAPGSYVREKH